MSDKPPDPPNEWREGDLIQVHEDLRLDNGDAAYGATENPQMDDGRSIPSADYTDQDATIADARAQVEAAYEGATPNTSESFNAEAQQQAHALPDDAGGKQVEYKHPEPAKEVPFIDPRDPDAAAVDEINDQVDPPVPTNQADVDSERFDDHARQEVIDAAKANLAERERNGEVLGGDPINRAEQWHKQGDNDRSYQQDCGLASTAAVLQNCGVEVTESAIVEQAVKENLCETEMPDPADNGGSDGQAISQLLCNNGVDNTIENPQTPENLAAYVEEGKGVIAEVNADELRGTPQADAYYDDEGRIEVDHAVQVTGTVRDAAGNLTGFVVNDTGSDDGAGQVVSMDQWAACWDNTSNDHETIVTSRPTSAERADR